MVQERRSSSSLTASLRLVTLVYFQTMAEMPAMGPKQPAKPNQLHAPRPDGLGILLIELTMFDKGEMRDETRSPGR